MSEEKRVISIDDFEHRLMVKGLIDFRNDLIKDEKPTEDIDVLLLKVIRAPTTKEKRRLDRDAR
ncbi:MAG: hypothetical protein J6D52_10900 [Clostridia bacterium]|nr:hypothetical protein [Clostridia bacterium]